MKKLVEGPGQDLLYEPVRVLRRERPAERALEALDNFAEGLEDLVRRMPESLALSGEELHQLLTPWTRLGLRRFVIKRRPRVEVRLREVAALHFSRELSRRAKFDAECLLILTQSMAALVEPWQDYRRYSLLQHGEHTVEANELLNLRKRWSLGVRKLRERGERQRLALRTWAGASIDRVACALAKNYRPSSDARAEVRQSAWQENFHFWSRQQRAVSGTIDLEWESTTLMVDVCLESNRALHSADNEQSDLLSELESVQDWLRKAGPSSDIGEMPPAVAQLVSAEDRVSAWLRAVESAAERRLSPVIETVEPKRAIPGWREPWRRLQPAKEFTSTFRRVGAPLVVGGFREAEGEHRAVIRAIEQARQVVRFSAETAAADLTAGPQIAQEGFANALSLVTFQRESLSDPHAKVEKSLVEGLASSFLLVHLRLEQHRLGFLTQLLRQSGSRARREIWSKTSQFATAGGRWAKRFGHDRYHWTLQKIGWEAPPPAISAPVVSRGYLGDTLGLQLGARDLPMIYRRLFRLAPVEDPRFLVGREAEMAELAIARDLWQSNRSVAVVLVGERGSGKTSMLNCLVARELSDLDVVRSQFSNRLTRAEDVRHFLHKLLDLPQGEDLEHALLAKKRIILIEELERTFLRKMNGFEGLLELLSIVSRTCRSTLWVLCLNQTSYQYLEAAIGLGGFFSHRINAMSIGPGQLKNAVMLRHNLSGLRLHFPDTEESNGRVERLRRFLGLQPAPEEQFFDSLYRQSGGVFRSAFELWQHYMDRVEAGVLYMRQPNLPDLDPLIAQLREPDLFALQAILQHGSVTVEEHAELFECSHRESRVQLERLENLECLEPDPAGPGLRIRPEAGRLVRIALARRNLI
ncbi:MAG: ATP-binding protein [Bryobacterales bacterium]|nr:ATP-binding protein [Bryobacterales bacterium]